MLDARKKVQAQIKALKNINVNTLFVEVVKKDGEIQETILELNKFNQLFNKGIDSKGEDLDSIGGGYRPFTIAIKNLAQQPVDRVTLFDTGDFYSSFKLVFGGDFVDITANFIKDGDDLRVRWGDNITGLTDESKTILQEDLLPLIQAYIRSKI